MPCLLIAISENPEAFKRKIFLLSLWPYIDFAECRVLVGILPSYKRLELLSLLIQINVILKIHSLSHCILSAYPVVMAHCTRSSCHKQSQTLFLNQLFLSVEPVWSCLLFTEPAVCRQQVHMGRKSLFPGFYCLVGTDIICVYKRAHMQCWVACRWGKTQKVKSS